jgi:hypothetical protein
MIKTKSRRSNAMVMLGGMALLALMGLGLSGCLIIPTPPHGGVGVIPEETIGSFEPSTTTRADVLLRVGVPAKRLQGDRFFVYKWKRIHAFLIVWFVVDGVGQEIYRPHYLGLEFTPKGRVKRVKALGPSFVFFDQYSKLEEWMAEEGESPDP